MCVDGSYIGLDLLSRMGLYVLGFNEQLMNMEISACMYVNDSFHSVL